MTLKVPKKLMQQAVNQPGGCIRITYKNAALFAPKRQVEDILAAMRQDTEAEVDRKMSGVTDMLDECIDRMLAKTLPQALEFPFIQSVAIWYAYECFKGRKNLEEERVH